MLFGLVQKEIAGSYVYRGVLIIKVRYISVLNYHVFYTVVNRKYFEYNI